MKHLYLWTTLAIATLVASILLWRMSATPYYPEVVIVLPGNITLTVIEHPWNSQEKCAQKHKAILARVREKCPNCTIRTSCPTELDAQQTRALKGQAINLPVVYTPLESTIIDAKAKEALLICNSMAEQITKQKIQKARCIAPANTR